LWGGKGGVKSSPALEGSLALNAEGGTPRSRGEKGLVEAGRAAMKNISCGRLSFSQRMHDGLQCRTGRVENKQRKGGKV